MGSHGYPRDKARKLDPVADAATISARITASSQLIRLKVDTVTGNPVTALDTGAPQIIRTAKLKQFLLATPLLARFVDRRLDENGVTVEGIAIHGGRLYAGLRGPVLTEATGDRAVIISVMLAALFDCGFNRSMQQFGGIVRRVFRSLESFLGARSIALPRR